ncbi:hypothetical protein GGI35DRAFT_430617 [Trichoderma velutinum]
MSANLRAPYKTYEAAAAKVQNAADVYNQRNAESCMPYFTEKTKMHTRGLLTQGLANIKRVLTKKFEKEVDYRIKKRLFLYDEYHIAARFVYEWRDATDDLIWKRSIGTEEWTFGEDGTLLELLMTATDVVIEESERWLANGVDGPFPEL